MTSLANGGHHGGRRVELPFQKTSQAVLPCSSTPNDGRDLVGCKSPVHCSGFFQYEAVYQM